MAYTITADKKSCLITATGSDLKNTFIDGARGMLSASYDVDQLKGNDSIEITAQATDYNELYQTWIEELRERSQLQEMVFVDVDIHSIQQINKTDMLLTGTAWATSIQDAQSHATGIHVTGVQKKSGSCVQKKGIWSCDITLMIS